ALAGAVGADHADLRPRVEGEPDVLEDLFLAVGLGEVLNGEDILFRHGSLVRARAPGRVSRGARWKGGPVSLAERRRKVKPRWPTPPGPPPLPPSASLPIVLQQPSARVEPGLRAGPEARPTVKAAFLETTGPPDVLRVGELPTPTPGP